jgi:hypothetical protein
MCSSIFEDPDVSIKWPHFKLADIDKWSQHSPKTPHYIYGYNCISWALGINTYVLTPDRNTWPMRKHDFSLQNFVDLFLNTDPPYEICSDGIFDRIFEKVAIYVIYDTETKEEEFRHVARQLETGRWTSKFGTNYEDIEHDSLEELKGPSYGEPRIFLRRPRI